MNAALPQFTYYHLEHNFWEQPNMYFLGGPSVAEPPPESDGDSHIVNDAELEVVTSPPYDWSLYDAVDEETEEDLLAPEPIKSM